MPWLSEYHLSLTAFSDASNSGWGGTIYFDPHKPTSVSAPWSREDRATSIKIREALALRNTLHVLSAQVQNARVDCYVDNQALVHVWQNGSSRSWELNHVLKEIFDITLNANLYLQLHYIPSADNPADYPSRLLSDLDCMLSPTAWMHVETVFGPHTIDLMAVTANVQLDQQGRPLKFYSPFPIIQS